jgi:uncharacterized cofD-like protein
MRDRKITKIVTIGGGSGQYVLLSGLRDVEGVDITAVVSMVDSGGSTGRLRDELGVLPPGDILKCVIALSPYRDVARKILQKRFTGQSRLNGHVAGNMLLTILSQYAGSFPHGVKALGEALNISGNVLPVTTDKATLVAELADGSALYGENVIDVPKTGQRAKITRTFLVPHHTENIFVHPPVIKAIRNADHIIIGPGDLYTSITPNFLVAGVKEAIKNSRADIIYIVNIMTKRGETDNYTGKDFILNLEKFIGRRIDTAVFNGQKPRQDMSKRYLKQGSEFVIIDMPAKWQKRRVISRDLLNSQGDLARHDGKKLARLICELVK